MATGEKQTGDFYDVLGVKRECSASDLKHAYKKLALRWHPDRCSALADSNFVEESKKKFQAIQEAYSVLSDANKRFLYDVGVYDDDDDNEAGMNDFLGEMAVMMSQTKPNEIGKSFEDLQELFDEMFPRESNDFGSTSLSGNFSSSNKRNCSDMNMDGEDEVNDLSSFQAESLDFCLCVSLRAFIWYSLAP
eukprot:TRINITY_DN7875_c0_g1_i1.p1 TRINITY_DN7875_c0_g1~~TRINITY_DN7875_c0_g1_i1.p1  ORF type:complete len:191 (+),score=21.58 TRINITY_DN7875_c0_g1_i1:295-867(+)